MTHKNYKYWIETEMIKEDLINEYNDLVQFQKAILNNDNCFSSLHTVKIMKHTNVRIKMVLNELQYRITQELK